MKLFYNSYLSKNSISPLEDVLNELSLFKQNNYCYDYIKKQTPGKNDIEIKEQAEMSSSSFRQAFEFLNSAKMTYITTSPLLYSYCINNFAKGLINLCNPTLNSYFKKHGFVVKNENVNSSLLKTSITIEKSGPPTAILKLLGNHVIEKQDITFDNLIKHIPEVSDLYLRTTNVSSSICKLNRNEYYELKSEDWECGYAMQKEEIDFLEPIGSYCGRTQSFVFKISMAGIENIKKNNCFEDIYYKDNLILPIKLNEGIYSINVMLYSYLIIMGYGMLVRYNANQWEKYIDPKLSNETILINESLIESVNIFIIHIHKILFNYTYESITYDDKNVEKVIKESTPYIMKNINEEIIKNSRRSGKTTYLPW